MPHIHMPGNWVHTFLLGWENAPVLSGSWTFMKKKLSSFLLPSPLDRPGHTWSRSAINSVYRCVCARYPYFIIITISITSFVQLVNLLYNEMNYIFMICLSIIYTHVPQTQTLNSKPATFPWFAFVFKYNFHHFL